MKVVVFPEALNLPAPTLPVKTPALILPRRGNSTPTTHESGIRAAA